MYSYVKHMEETEQWYLESSSNRKELLTALLESSVIKYLMLEITYVIMEEIQKNWQQKIDLSGERGLQMPNPRIELASYILW